MGSESERDERLRNAQYRRRACSHRMGGGKAEADWTRICRVPWALCGKALRLAILLRRDRIVANGTGLEGFRKRSYLRGDGLLE